MVGLASLELPRYKFFMYALSVKNLKSVALILSHPEVVLLTVSRYAEYRFVLVEKMRSAKNIWEPVIVNVIISGLLMADTSIPIAVKLFH